MIDVSFQEFTFFPLVGIIYASIVTPMSDSLDFLPFHVIFTTSIALIIKILEVHTL